MPVPAIHLDSSSPLTVGSFGSGDALRQISPAEVRESCDVVELRLDLLDQATRDEKPWRRFKGMPLLFTARRASEGGSGNLETEARLRLLHEHLEDASLIDLEVASIGECTDFIGELKASGIPWIASFHDFSGVPDLSVLQAARMKSREAGAAAFKAAVELRWDTGDLAALAGYVANSTDYPVSLMGMGPLAPASRVMFAQLGSVLNYGYLGDTPTAPGQWSARQLRDAIGNVVKAHS